MFYNLLHFVFWHGCGFIRHFLKACTSYYENLSVSIANPLLLGQVGLESSKSMISCGSQRSFVWLHSFSVLF